MRERAPTFLSTLGLSVGAATVAFALGTAVPALADDAGSALTDPAGTSPQALVQAVVATTMPMPTASVTPTTDAVANPAPTPPVSAPVSAASVVSAPVAATPTVAPAVPGPTAPPATTPAPTPDPAPSVPAPSPAPAPAQAAPAPPVPAATPGAPTPPATTAAPAPAPSQPQQYQTPNTTDTNSSANNAPSSSPQTVEKSADSPQTVDSIVPWNWDWDRLVTCSSCNVSITIRVLSPGNDGPVVQTNANTSTGLASALDSLQQRAVAVLPVAPTQPAVPMPVVPAVVAQAPLPVPAVLPAIVEPAPSQELDTAPETAAPPDDVVDDSGAIPDLAAPPPTVVTEPVATDTSSIPRVHEAHSLGNAHRAVRATAPAGRDVLLAPPITPPALAPAVATSAGTAATPMLEPASTGGRASRPPPSRTPSHRPPPEGPYVGSAPTVPGADAPSDSPAGLLALLVFLVPGFAQWLWARVELRPEAVRSGRPERPG